MKCDKCHIELYHEIQFGMYKGKDAKFNMFICPKCNRFKGMMYGIDKATQREVPAEG